MAQALRCEPLLLKSTKGVSVKAIPIVQKYMTHVPKSIGYDQTIAQANDFMKKLKLRHLPVLKGGKLVGLISDRDINLLLQ